MCSLTFPLPFWGYRPGTAPTSAHEHRAAVPDRAHARGAARGHPGRALRGWPATPGGEARGEPRSEPGDPSRRTSEPRGRRVDLAAAAPRHPGERARAPCRNAPRAARALHRADRAERADPVRRPPDPHRGGGHAGGGRGPGRRAGHPMSHRPAGASREREAGHPGGGRGDPRTTSGRAGRGDPRRQHLRLSVGERAAARELRHRPVQADGGLTRAPRGPGDQSRACRTSRCRACTTTATIIRSRSRATASTTP